MKRQYIVLVVLESISMFWTDFLHDSDASWNKRFYNIMLHGVEKNKSLCQPELIILVWNGAFTCENQKNHFIAFVSRESPVIALNYYSFQVKEAHVNYIYSVSKLASESRKKASSPNPKEWNIDILLWFKRCVSMFWMAFLCDSKAS